MVNIKNTHFLTLFSVFGFITADIICQDEGICRDDETCCLLSSNIFGCCPYPKSTCCSDGKYCCPYDYTCDLKEHQCFRGSHKRDMLEKHPAKRIHGNARNPFSVNIFQNLELMNLGNVLCPDRCSTCPDTYTCCLLLSGEYGCCPYSNAVCCNDYSHCCPYNYVCNIPNCVPNQRFEYKDLTKTAPYIKKENLLSYFDQKPVFCKDTSVCAEGSTCCLKPDGNYACCPYPNADCCSDGIHCCPSGFLCSIETKNCVKENKILPMLQKQKAKLIPPNKKKIFNSEIENILCPGDLYFCPTSERCCLIKQDVYGCCPQSAIVSCEDNTFYCPEDTKCDMKKFKCITNNGSFTNLLQKKLASLVKNAVAERQNLPILCPDNIHFCDSVSSCCLLKNGEYGCCPISSSVVCDDNIHCCPPGSECNIGGCLNVENKITTSLKITISKLRTICPGGSTCCPSSYTCCLLESEEYGCCPLPQATCCSDRIHCCPYGYLCDGSGTCSNGAESIKALKKLKSFHLTKEIIPTVSDVHCPDGVSLCPDGNTCCKLNTGEYSCCPLLNAVCCADQESCCPHGYSCVSGGFCARGNERVKGLVHTSAILKVKNVDCPDGVSQCSDGSTCCKIGSDQYGCCPLENAVCCADHKHCCPHGYSCSSRGFCTRGNERVKGLVHTSAILKVKNVDCPDHVSQCPDGSTCCKMLPDQYGCCPLENAVCCADHNHCCPHGYSCSSGGFCTRGNERVKGLVHTSAILKVKNVDCPDHVSQCPDGSTCCKISSDQYGCCPLENAVCCDDLKHCCPHGYSCSSGGVCYRKEKKEPAIKLRNARTDKKTLGHSDGFNTNKKDEGDYVFY